MSEETAKLNAFPVFLRVEGRRVVVVGGGEEALAKARLLAQSSAALVVVAPLPEPDLAVWAAANGVRLELAAYRPEHLD
ncbi:NAD(P)-dependent oxidoreductase, partial [Nitratireductor sp. GCM10026969]|uniref:NAD(P)-dependent oxidoreductase n=1 Tax=Nitratireductor sp. GCM10026969 TaxID=3252645 RepID=UPI003621B8AE